MSTIFKCRECNAQIQATRILCRKCAKKASLLGLCVMCGLNPKAEKHNAHREPQGTFYEYCESCMEIRGERFESYLERQLELQSKPEAERRPRRKRITPEKKTTMLPWD